MGKRFARVNRRPLQFLCLSVSISIVFTLPLLRLFGVSCIAADNSTTARILSTAILSSNGLTITSPPPLAASTGGLGITTGSRADWGDDVYQAHPFCKTLIETPEKAPVPACTRNANKSCADGSKQGTTPFFSQVAQDYYLYTRHFKYLNRPGVYVEAGTRHPVTGSNTYFFDVCLSWRGMCVEANPNTLAYIHRERSCELVPTCLTEHDNKLMSFLMMAEAGGIEDTNKNKDTYKGDIHRIRLPCMSMQRMLQRRNVTVVDYFSLDVEGHELEVLKGIDHSKTIINTMTIETTPESLRELEAYLEPLGYVRHKADLDHNSRRTGLLRRDAIFLHKSVQWGKPV